jgi:putative ABC transport system permease protein
MIKHLFKMIWNKKKKNSLVILQLFFCFAVLFAVFTLGIYYFQSYNKPAGFNYSDVWTVSRTASQNMDNNTSTSKEDSANSRNGIALIEQNLKNEIKTMADVLDVSYSGTNIPYTSSFYNTDIFNGKTSTRSDILTVEDNYADMMKMKMFEGRWFSRDDNGSNYTPVVINEKLKEALFGGTNVLNQLTTINGKNHKIVGVVNDTKTKDDYTDPGYSVFVRADSSFYGIIDNKVINIKVKPGSGVIVEGRLYKLITSLLKTTSIEIGYLDTKRQEANRVKLVPLLVLVIVAVFFLINVALGLFGVLWYNINKRQGEIGLRMALGANKSTVSGQMVGETIALSTISIALGVLVAVQFPLLNAFDLPAHIYLLAILISIVLIYLLVFICSYYPGRQAAAISPAVALHEE